MPTDTEIRQWTAAVHKHLPEALIKGVLREASGLLVQVPGEATTADDMQRYEMLLRCAGATGWAWSIGPAGVSMRVRFEPHRGFRRIWLVLLAAAGLAGLVWIT